MIARRLRGLRRLADGILVAGFLLAIALPLGDMLVGLDPTPALTEKRRLAPPPKLRPGEVVSVSYVGALESWWNDNFGFRRALVSQYSRLQLAFGVSPTKSVILGKAGWLFFADDDALASFRALRPFTEEELELWRRRMERRRDWLAARGVRFLVVVAPSKETIYPEFMPDTFTRVRATSRMDQLAAYLRARSTVDVLDLRAPLSEAKGRGVVYLRTDTHWNDRGAWLAAAAIVARLDAWFPGLRALPESAFEPVIHHGWSGDLVAMLSLQGRLHEPRLELRPRGGRLARPVAIHLPDLEAQQIVSGTETGDATLPRAVMFHDSFGLSLQPFLSERFARIVYSSGSGDWRRNFDPGLVERERPQVVIQEIAERLLVAPAALLKTAPEGI
jgi:alginate O-acetyltransferase complex protein AlgJ